MAWMVDLAAGKTLMQEGEESLSMYLLQEGELVVSRNNVVLEHIHSGEIVGELSFLDKKPRSATVKAVTDCKLIQIPQSSFDAVFNNQPGWLDALIESLVVRLREADKRIKV